MAGPHCLIYEPDVTGHRLQHVRHLADALLVIGCRVSLALPSDFRDHPEFTVHISAHEPRINIFSRLDPHQSPRLSARWRRLKELFNTIDELNPDRAYVPFADGLTQLAAVESALHGSNSLRRVPIEGQVMRGKYAYPKRTLRESIGAAANRYFMQRSPWDVTHMLDPFAFSSLEPPAGSRFRLIPEPVETLPKVDRCEARATLGIPNDGRYLAFVGGLFAGKGVELLLEAFAHAKVSDSDRLLFVGKIAPPIRELLNRTYAHLLRQGTIVIVDRYVTDHELDCGFLAADVVAVVHPRQIGSSGTLVRGAAAKRHILASDFGWVGWCTETFQLGDTVNVSNRDSYATAITEALRASHEYRAGAAAERFCQYHTVANQKAHWVAEIGRTLGLPLGVLDQRIDWHSVLDALPSTH